MTTPVPALPRAPRPVWRVVTLVTLVLATLAAFASLWNADWILFDDPTYVYRNSAIVQGLSAKGLRWIFAHPHGGNFHPVTSIAHMLAVDVFGLAPRGHHLLNVGLHALNAVLVCLVLWRYTGAWWRSAIVAGFFALHPTHVESVAWVSELKDLLSTLFLLLTLLVYERWTQVRTLGLYVALALCCLLGLLAKPMLVTLPFLLLLLDAWPLGRGRWPLVGRGLGGLWREKLPLFALAFATSLTTFLVQRAAGAVMAAETLTIPQRVTNATANYARYLEATFWPVDLANFYPLADPWPLGMAAVGAVLLVVVTWIAWRLRAGHGYLLAGWLWFVGTLVPVIGLVQVGSASHADRYQYIPSIGLAVALVWTCADLVSRSGVVRSALVASTLVALVACGVATSRVAARWKDTRTLFSHALSVTEPSAVSLQNLGNALLKDGEIDRAMECLEQALVLVPGFPDAENNLGAALGMKGRPEEAIAHFHSALLTDDTAELHLNLGWALEHANRGEEAIPEYLAALQRDPDFVDAHEKLGAQLAARGRYEEAAKHLQRALELNASNPETYRTLAITRVRQNRVEDGIRAYHEVLARLPDDLDALNNIAWIRATHVDPSLRNGAEAVRLAERARDLPHDPNHVLFSTLAAAYAEVGRFDDAVHAAERAVELARTAQDEDAARRFSAQLDSYRRREPLRL